MRRSAERPRRFATGRLLGLIASVAVIAMLAVGPFLLPSARWVPPLVERAREAGGVGAAVFALAFIVATVFLVPGTLAGIAAGFLYGPVLGVAIMWPTSVLAALAAFLVGRTIARRWARLAIEGQPIFRAVDEGIATQGFKIVLLLRLSPIVPFNLINYALAATRISPRDYILGSALGILPGVVLYVYVGSVVTRVSEIATGGVARESLGSLRAIWYVAGLAATIAATVVIGGAASRALERARLAPTSGARSGTPGEGSRS